MIRRFARYRSIVTRCLGIWLVGSSMGLPVCVWWPHPVRHFCPVRHLSSPISSQPTTRSGSYTKPSAAVVCTDNCERIIDRGVYDNSSGLPAHAGIMPVQRAREGAPVRHGCTSGSGLPWARFAERTGLLACHARSMATAADEDDEKKKQAIIKAFFDGVEYDSEHPEVREKLEAAGDDVQKVTAISQDLKRSLHIFKFWNEARERGIHPHTEIANHVLGVVEEIAFKDGAWLLTCGLSDGHGIVLNHQGDRQERRPTCP